MFKRHFRTFLQTFISSTNEGNPPMDMNVTKPKIKEAQDPLACFHSSEMA